MTAAAVRVVIVGGSVAGVRIAQELRAREFAGEVILIEAEPRQPYDKPPLSKALLEGTIGVDDLALMPASSVEGLDLTVLLGRPAAGLDPVERVVVLEDGEQVGFDHLVIATGARARTAPWADQPGVRVLRTLDDALAVMADLEQAGRLVVCGAGFIGSEAASVARRKGIDVVLIDPVEVPMARIVGTDVGRWFIDLHARHGVDLRLGTGITGVEPTRDGFDVALSDGTTVRGDAVLVGIGAVPNTEWLESSGLAIDNGVVCDGRLSAVGHPMIHAIGDVARWADPVRGLTRIEHWTNAGDQAAYVAQEIVSGVAAEPYTADGYVWSDQYDWHVQVAGRLAAAGATTTVIGDPADYAAVLYSDETGQVTGVLAINWPKALMPVRRAMKRGESLSLDDAVAQVEKARPKSR